MKSITHYLGLLCLILVVLTSCNYDNDTNIMDNDEITEKPSFGGVVKSEINFDEFSYNLSKPLVSNQGIIDYKELEIPDKVGDLKMGISRIFDEQRFLVYLYEDTVFERDKELGFYNFVTNKYETLFTITLEDDQYDRSISI